jgi:hypothetical protein
MQCSTPLVEYIDEPFDYDENKFRAFWQSIVKMWNHLPNWIRNGKMKKLNENLEKIRPRGFKIYISVGCINGRNCSDKNRVEVIISPNFKKNPLLIAALIKLKPKFINYSIYADGLTNYRDNPIKNFKFEILEKKEDVCYCKMILSDADFAKYRDNIKLGALAQYIGESVITEYLSIHFVPGYDGKGVLIPVFDFNYCAFCCRTNYQLSLKKIENTHFCNNICCKEFLQLNKIRLDLVTEDTHLNLISVSSSSS